MSSQRVCFACSDPIDSTNKIGESLQSLSGDRWHFECIDPSTVLARKTQFAQGTLDRYNTWYNVQLANELASLRKRIEVLEKRDGNS